MRSDKWSHLASTWQSGDSYRTLAGTHLQIRTRRSIGSVWFASFGALLPDNPISLILQLIERSVLPVKVKIAKLICGVQFLNDSLFLIRHHLRSPVWPKKSLKRSHSLKRPPLQKGLSPAYKVPCWIVADSRLEWLAKEWGSDRISSKF